MLDFFKELKRRKVWLFGGVYLALSWVLLQVAIAVEDTLALPGWVDQVALLLLVLGFPVALLLAWAQESVAPASNAELIKEDASPTPAIDDAPAETRTTYSYAVLPFTNLSSDEALEHIGDGVAEDLITSLNSRSITSVVARNSSFAFKGTSPDIRDVGKKLNVNYVIEGSVRETGGKLRITAQAIDTRTGEHVWAAAYDHAREEIDLIWDHIITRMNSELTAGVAARVSAIVEKRPKGEVSAEELATYCMVKAFIPFSPREIRNSLALMRENFPNHNKHSNYLAYMATLASWCATFAQRDYSEMSTLAEQWIEQAGRLSPDDKTKNFVAAEAAHIMNRLGRHAEALTYAEAVEPAFYAHVQYELIRGEALFGLGRFDEALIEINERLAAMGPQHYNRIEHARFLGWVQMALGDFSSAEENFRKGMTPPIPEWARRGLIVALAHQGKLKEAEEAIETYKAAADAISAAQIADHMKLATDDLGFLAMYLKGLEIAGMDFDSVELDQEGGA
jgi:TolB-like protein/tetratricopeptide (TPR) repeat protein